MAKVRSKYKNIDKLIELGIIKDCDYSKEGMEWLQILRSNWTDIQISKLIEAYHLALAVLELDGIIREKLN